MKRSGGHKTIGIASIVVALVLGGTVVWLLNKPPTGDCADGVPDDHKAQEIRATKVVVQPWLGKHHVYGVFMVPEQYKHKNKYMVRMTVHGFDGYFAVGEGSDKQYMDDALAAPGRSLLRGYLPTRVALWFMVNGLFGDLRHPCNWLLVLVERSS